MDIEMPVMNGIEAARLIRQRLPDTKIVFFVAEVIWRSQAMAIGADAFLLKETPIASVIESIRRVAGPHGAARTHALAAAGGTVASRGAARRRACADPRCPAGRTVSAHCAASARRTGHAAGRAVRPSGIYAPVASAPPRPPAARRPVCGAGRGCGRVCAAGPRPHADVRRALSDHARRDHCGRGGAAARLGHSFQRHEWLLPASGDRGGGRGGPPRTCRAVAPQSLGGRRLGRHRRPAATHRRTLRPRVATRGPVA